MNVKRLVLISLLAAAVGVIAFIGCERPEPIDPNEGQPQTDAEDSLINQQTKIEHWRAVLPDGYYNYQDGTFHYNETYTYAYMDIYPEESVLHAVDIDTADIYLIISNGLYSPYSMNGDTITVNFHSEIELAEKQRKWLISRANDTIMYWQYLGSGIPENNNNYIFYLIGVE